ncbi:hypothetical protein A6R68_12929 [Neotoma lepida]|uniref:Non-selective voltage-gated ion channel VDAC1 n=1 Tax=Neotoma lepida TaxID=56216 RepID=A0A1A6H2A0_NEOLE|nr:hypothetical protein A6R68_12929 [Neotoma lepida]
MNFETLKSRVTQSNFAVGYKRDEVQLHTNVNDGTEFGGSIYQKANKKVESPVSLAWTAENSNTHFRIAAKYHIDPDAKVEMVGMMEPVIQDLILPCSVV